MIIYHHCCYVVLSDTQEINSCYESHSVISVCYSDCMTCKIA